MTPELRRAPSRPTDKASERAHEKARMLASDAIDAELAPADAAWLDGHLAGCSDCQSAADDYRSLHDELRGLALPEPPRDLWARTSAGLDSIDRSRAGRASRAGWTGPRLGDYLRGRSSVGSVVAVTVTVFVVGLSLLSQGPLFVPTAAPSATANVAFASPAPSSGTQAALTLVDGNSYWVTPDNGVYQIKAGAASCTGSPESCAVTNGKGTVLGSIASKSAVSVVISSNATQAAVWNGSKIVILPLTDATPATVAMDLLTPRPATPAPTPAPTETPATPPPPSATAPAPTTQASSKPQPTKTPRKTHAPTPGTTNAPTTPVPTTEPAPTPSPTVAPTPTPVPATPTPTSAVAGTSGQPLAILDGYKIVGGGPLFSADGRWLAFSARPVTASSGSDVFVWRVGWDRAQAVTTSGADLLAGWLGTRILISEFVSTPAPTATAPASVTAISYLYDPAATVVRRIDRSMLMPVVDPTGRYVVYWAGSVAYNAATGLYGPGKGGFFFDAWSNVQLVVAPFGGSAASTPSPQPTAVASASPAAADSTAPSPLGSSMPGATDKPSASPVAQADQSAGGSVAPALAQPTSTPDTSSGLPQRIPVASGAGASWSVRWDATGRYVAIWVANAGATDVGHVTLLNVIPGSQLLNVGGLLLSAPARSNVQFDDSQFVYTSPAQGGDAKTYLFQLPAIPPTPPVTPVPTAAPTGSSPDEPSSTRSQSVSTDRPGS